MNELKENSDYIGEVIFNNAWSEYRFSGPNGPIVGIPGVMGGWVKDGLRSFMQKNDVEGHLLFLGTLTNGLTPYMSIVRKEIYKYDYPVIVGYSTGGLLALRCVSEDKTWDKIKKIITIATPFQGIQSAQLKILGKTISEISPESTLLRDVLSIIPPENKVLSVFASEDTMVGNPDAISLNWEKHVVQAQSHGDIQNHDRWIEDTLKNELF